MRYRYTGDVPRLFPTLPGGPTLEPGQEVGVDGAVDHPDLESLKPKAVPAATTEAPKEAK